MSFSEMDAIFNRTKGALVEFMGIITPIIENSTDDHERLYWHHIFEEEEHRSDRLGILMPKIQGILGNGGKIPDNQLEYVHLLQDISLEKFGLHNFLEHLDLSLFQFKGTEFEEKIHALRDFTFADYQEMKTILEKLNEPFHGSVQFQTSIPTDEKDGHGSNVKIDTYSHGHTHDESAQAKKQQVQVQPPKKGLTVGSLKQH